LVSLGLSFKEPPPASVDAGAQFALSLTVSWPKGVEPEGATYRVLKDDKPIASGVLPGAAEDGSIALGLAAPKAVGEQKLTLVVAAAEKPKREPVEGLLSFTVTTVPHATSLAVWDTPSPVVRGAMFEIKVGAKCTSSCRLGGRGIEVVDESGEVVGSGALTDEIVPETTSLYWTTLTVHAPQELEHHAWSVRFAASGLELPHEGDASSFSFITVAEPEHSVLVKVVNKETKAPIEGAQIRLGQYRAITDAAGVASVSVPKGKFPLVVTHVGYDMPERTIKVEKDVRVRIAAEKLPEEDPFAMWTA